MSKPFDLEAAKAGAPVMTRDGKPARIICFDRKTHSEAKVALVALIMDDSGQENVSVYHLDGSNPLGPGWGLVMAPVTQRLYANLYREGSFKTFGRIFEHQDDAKQYAAENSHLEGAKCVAVAVPIEWQE